MHVQHHNQEFNFFSLQYPGGCCSENVLLCLTKHTVHLHRVYISHFSPTAKLSSDSMLKRCDQKLKLSASTEFIAALCLASNKPLKTIVRLQRSKMFVFTFFGPYLVDEDSRFEVNFRSDSLGVHFWSCINFARNLFLIFVADTSLPVMQESSKGIPCGLCNILLLFLFGFKLPSANSFL